MRTNQQYCREYVFRISQVFCDLYKTQIDLADDIVTTARIISEGGELLLPPPLENRTAYRRPIQAGEFPLSFGPRLSWRSFITNWPLPLIFRDHAFATSFKSTVHRQFSRRLFYPSFADSAAPAAEQ
jgi:hypothetical protein